MLSYTRNQLSSLRLVALQSVSSALPTAIVEVEQDRQMRRRSQHCRHMLHQHRRSDLRRINYCRYHHLLLCPEATYYKKSTLA